MVEAYTLKIDAAEVGSSDYSLRHVALYLRSVCVSSIAFRGLKVSSADLHAIETTFNC